MSLWLGRGLLFIYYRASKAKVNSMWFYLVT